jgi:hypothetical protein
MPHWLRAAWAIKGLSNVNDIFRSEKTTQESRVKLE